MSGCARRLRNERRAKRGGEQVMGQLMKTVALGFQAGKEDVREMAGSPANAEVRADGYPYQPTFIRVRDDVDDSDCDIVQLKMKPNNETK
jgi:hypothetical protein